MNKTNPKVDAYFSKTKTWRDEMERLRAILLGCGLTEELKWGKPSYGFEGGNIAILQPFNESCALMFFKGALLKDPNGLLERPGENSHAARRIKFTSVREIDRAESSVKAFVREAIAAEKAGLKVEARKEPEPVPAELQEKLDRIPALKKAFAALTPGRQRAYLLHFSAPKQSKTRASRVEKCMPQILAGKGLNDR